MLTAAFLIPAVGAQTPAPVSVAVANPTYVTLVLDIMVDRPAAEVWNRIGKFCDIGAWIPADCKIVAGKENEVGAIRTVGNEILVGRTDLSYTYTQAVREGRPYNLYHGTLEAKPITATTTKLIYTLFFDNSMLPDDAAREKDKASRTATFSNFLKNMKTLAEGGTLPPRPAAAPSPGNPVRQ
jgi:hypothetical protein